MAFNGRKMARLGVGKEETRLLPMKGWGAASKTPWDENGSYAGICYNRRTKKPDGQVAMNLTLPPRDADLTFGPVDPEVGVMRVEDENGNLIAALINFACHPVSSTDRMYAISADYPGVAMNLVEANEGGICMFALGCAGNIVPIQRQGKSKQKIGTSLGASALRALQWIRTSQEVKLKAAQVKKEVPLKELPTKKEAQKAVQEKEDMQSRRTLAFVERFGSNRYVETEVQALRIGDIVLVGLPGEVFVEIGLEIKRRLKLTNIFVISLANDGLSYVPTADEYPVGGYETNWTYLAPGAGEILLEAAVELVSKVPKS